MALIDPDPVRSLSGHAARIFVYNALICYHLLFRAYCHKTAVNVVCGVAIIPDCRPGFGPTLDADMTRWVE